MRESACIIFCDERQYSYTPMGITRQIIVLQVDKGFLAEFRTGAIYGDAEFIKFVFLTKG
jgi:hypothetical protein